MEKVFCKIDDEEIKASGFEDFGMWYLLNKADVQSSIDTESGEVELKARCHSGVADEILVAIVKLAQAGLLEIREGEDEE